MDHSNIAAVPPEIKPLASRASVDTIEVFLGRPPAGLRRRIERATGQCAQIKDCVDRTGHWQGARVIFNRPTPACLAVIADISRVERQSTICRVDVAVDFRVNSESDVDALADWIDHHVVLKWRSSRTRKRVVKSTVYWCDARKGRNIALYRKRDCVVRMELRLFSTASVRRAGLDDLTKLVSINPQGLFNHHVKARRFTERFKIKAIREAVKQERKRAAAIKNRRNKQTQQFVDRYRSRIRQRVRHVLNQIDAQSMGRRGTENINLDFLEHGPVNLSQRRRQARSAPSPRLGEGWGEGGGVERR